MTMQNPFGAGFGNAGLQLPDPNAPPPPMKLLSPEESEQAGIDALQHSTVSPIALSSGGTLPPTVVDAAKQRAAMAMASGPATGPVGPTQVPTAAASSVAPTLAPATVAAAKARAGGRGAPKGPSLQQQFLEARRLGGEADIAGVRAQQTGMAMHADLLDQQRDEAEQRMVERQARQAERDRSIDQQMGQLSQDVDAVKNIRFDANRVFASPAGILGAAASAMRTGTNERIMGRNLAEDSLKDAISRDFDEQKANAAQKSTALGAKQNLVTMMRANYQDRNQADMAAEIAHKEAAAQQILALAAHSKVPEMQAQADKLAAGIQEDAAKLKMQFQAQAAAAAAAAEKQRWDRSMQVREQLRKEGETDSVIQKNLAEKGDKLDEQTGKIAAQMQSAGIPEAEAAAQRALASTREGGTVVNTNPLSNAFAKEFPLLYKIAAGDKAAAAQQDFAAFRNAGQKAISGVAVSPSEKPGLTQQFENAQTPEDRTRAVNNLLEAMARGRANILAGASPKAADAYQQRFNARAPQVNATAPAGFIPGGGQ
jgi:hypothetical protein